MERSDRRSSEDQFYDAPQYYSKTVFGRDGLASPIPNSYSNHDSNYARDSSTARESPSLNKSSVPRDTSLPRDQSFTSEVPRRREARSPRGSSRRRESNRPSGATKNRYAKPEEFPQSDGEGSTERFVTPEPTPYVASAPMSSGGQRVDDNADRFARQKPRTYEYGEKSSVSPKKGYAPVQNEAPGYDSTQPAPNEAQYGKRQGSFIWRHKWALILALIVAIIVIGLAVGLGAGLGTRNNNTASSSASKPPSDPKSSGPDKLDALSPWNWTDTKNKVYGANIGGWLVLERWMYEDWMVDVGGPDAWDEWTFSEKLGDRATDALQKHYDTWFTEDDMEWLHRLGVNMVRIPIGFWSFIPTQGDEPYKNASQLDRLSKALHWAHKRKMYVLVDLHGLPGSQNGDQSSGRNMSAIDSFSNDDVIPWFNETNQKRSHHLVDVTLAWLNQSDSRSVVSGLTTVNEPQTKGGDGSNKGKLHTLEKFYKRNVEVLKKYNMPFIFHHGFVSGNPFEIWHKFASDLDPSMAVFDDHPYPGWFPPKTDFDKINKIMCQEGNRSTDYPLPVLIGEWSGVSNLTDMDNAKRHIENQLYVYGWSAGSMFFNFKVNESSISAAAPPADVSHLWSLTYLKDHDAFPSRDTSKSVIDFTDTLSKACGKDPGNTW